MVKFLYNPCLVQLTLKLTSIVGIAQLLRLQEVNVRVTVPTSPEFNFNSKLQIYVICCINRSPVQRRSPNYESNAKIKTTPERKAREQFYRAQNKKHGRLFPPPPPAPQPRPRTEAPPCTGGPNIIMQNPRRNIPVAFNGPF